MANHARIGIYQFKPNTLNPLIEKGRRELPDMVKQQPGFLRYTVVQSGPDEIVSLSAWETREQSDNAAKMLVGWVRQTFEQDMDSVENLIGEMILTEWSVEHLPSWGRVNVLKLQGPLSEVTRLARDEIVPLIKRQPGFNSHAAMRISDDRVATFTTFDSRAQGEAGLMAVEPVWQQRIAPYVTDRKMYAGDLLWSVRKGYPTMPEADLGTSVDVEPGGRA